MAGSVVLDCLANFKDMVSAIEMPNSDKPVSVLNHDQMLTRYRKKRDREGLGLPILGIVYTGLSGVSDQSQSGIAATITLDLYLLGLEGEETMKTRDEKADVAMAYLDSVRSILKAKRNPKHRLWTFVSESPLDLGIGDLEFVQTWASIVTI